MAEYYSTHFGVPHSTFESMGVFDGLIGADIKLHIDPLRLKTTQIGIRGTGQLGVHGSWQLMVKGS